MQSGRFELTDTEVGTSRLNSLLRKACRIKKAGCAVSCTPNVALLHSLLLPIIFSIDSVVFEYAVKHLTGLIQISCSYYPINKKH